MRTDLLALTTDDLTLIANRGLVKRAQAELQAGELLYTIAEDEQGNLTIGWSDETTCRIPAGQPLSAARCSCPATTICRHILRSVLAYQQFAAQEAPAQPPQTWDPGTIDDATLARVCANEALTWARKTHAAGQVIELVRSSKPSAYLHGFGIAVRFLVPSDPRYTHCDCAEAAPCRHVPLAVLAFRQLDPNATSGIIETAVVPAPIPIDLLDDLAQALGELIVLGLSNAPPALLVKLRRIEQRCRDAELQWPADALAELTQQHDAYAAHDARFDPSIVTSVLGELCVRSDAIRSNTGAVPQLFVRGSNQTAETRLEATRLVGLGCSVQVRRGGAELTAYQQDINSGALSVVRVAITDPSEPSAQPNPWRHYAQTPIAKGINLEAFASGQVLLKSARRFANGELKLGRAPASALAQAYNWETLRAPLLAESIAELSARIAAQPPAVSPSVSQSAPWPLSMRRPSSRTSKPFGRNSATPMAIIFCCTIRTQVAGITASRHCWRRCNATPTTCASWLGTSR